MEPPGYLLRVNPEIYAEEQQRVARRFEEAVQLAEQAFLGEFGKLVAHLTERLGGGDGERRVCRRPRHRRIAAPHPRAGLLLRPGANAAAAPTLATLRP